MPVFVVFLNEGDVAVDITVVFVIFFGDVVFVEEGNFDEGEVFRFLEDLDGFVEVVVHVFADFDFAEVVFEVLQVHIEALVVGLVVEHDAEVGVPVCGDVAPVAHPLDFAPEVSYFEDDSVVVVVVAGVVEECVFVEVLVFEFVDVQDRVLVVRLEPQLLEQVLAGLGVACAGEDEPLLVFRVEQNVDQLVVRVVQDYHRRERQVAQNALDLLLVDVVVRAVRLRVRLFQNLRPQNVFVVAREGEFVVRLERKIVVDDDFFVEPVFAQFDAEVGVVVFCVEDEEFFYQVGKLAQGANDADEVFVGVFADFDFF